MVLVCAAAVLALTATETGTLCADPDNRSIVVLREDDIRYTWLTPFAGLGGVSALTYGKSKQIPITWAVITDAANSPTGFNWAVLIDYVDHAGGELASHSCKHSPMNSEQEYIDELINSKAAIEANFPGYTCTTFLQPGPWQGPGYIGTFDKLDNPVGRELQRSYAQSQAYLTDWWGGWSIGNVYYRYGLMCNYNIEYGQQATPDSVRSVLDLVAATPGVIIVVTCHGVQETGGTASDCVQADVLKAFMDKLADLRDSGKVRLMSMRDAYNASFSTDLNHVPDPGFELYTPGPLYPIGPWKLSGFTSITQSGGLDNSKYAAMPHSWDRVESSKLTLAPGRYQLKWWQKPESGYPPNRNLFFWIVNSRHFDQHYAADWTGVQNTGSDWEEKTALFVVPQKYPMTMVGFSPSSPYGIDNVSIVSAPLDPMVSPTAGAASPSPAACTMSWDTPNDPEVTSITVRRGTSAHPKTPSEGSLLATLPALPGQRQQTTFSISWGDLSQAYFSIFAHKANGDYSPPELVLVIVDSSGPTTPEVQAEWLPDDTVSASWISTDLESGVYQYKYCVGTDTKHDNVIPWTYTSMTSAVLSGIPPDVMCYLSVKAQNSYGYWSSTKSIPLLRPCGIPEALSSPDGTHVTVTGTVTAVFADFHYVASSLRVNGIRVQGTTEAHEGDEVTVSGTMDTVNGERVIIPDP